MLHQMANKRLSRTDPLRPLLLRSLTTSFFLHEKIETTSTKREISKIAERKITQARRGDLYLRHLVAEYLLDPGAVKKLVRANRTGLQRQDRRLHPYHQVARTSR